jgi:site-specific recombinase XerD
MFVKWLEQRGVTRPEEVRAAHVRAWLAEASQRGLRDTSVHAGARGVKTMLRFWLEEKYLSEAVTFAMPRLEKRLLPFLSPAQFKVALRAAHTKRDRAILLFLADSGVRRGEALALNWEDVSFQSGAVLIRLGKGNKARVTAVGERTRKALMSYRRGRKVGEGDPLFVTDEGGRLTPMGVRSLFLRLSTRAGFNISPHMLRRTFAIQSLRAGMDLIALQRLMGHASVEMTEHYVQYLTDDVLAEHAAHGLDQWA